METVLPACVAVTTNRYDVLAGSGTANWKVLSEPVPPDRTLLPFWSRTS
ncbi:MAG TPA: hypothetical protein VEM95_03710 [Thermoplasmata archaeon]|nr:hypothetical protein [Thermoplasmata archaeon]